MIIMISISRHDDDDDDQQPTPGDPNSLLSSRHHWRGSAPHENERLEKKSTLKF